MLSILLLSFLALAATGLKCPAGTSDQNDTCVACEPGYYRQASGTLATKECVPCPPGTSQPAFGAVAPDLCRFCWPGTYAPKKASTKCMTCPGSTSSFYGANKCSTCKPGSYILPKGEGCKPCPIGFYSDQNNAVKCTQCPYLTTTNAEGGSSITDCKPCTDGPNCLKCGDSQYYEYYNPGNVSASQVTWHSCRRCPSGTYYTGSKPITSGSQCVPCPKGTFRNAVGYNAICKPCKAGTTTAAPGGVLCRPEGGACPADTFETDDGNCIFCDRGYRFVPHQKICVKCPPGHVSGGGVRTGCRRCPNNLHPDRDQMFCVCGVGTYRKLNRCILCPKGTSMERPDHNQPACSECGSGEYTSSKGSASCEHCPLGLILENSGKSTACVKCPKGSMPNILKESYYENDLAYHSFCVSPQTRCPPATVRTTVGTSETFFGCKGIECSRENVESDLNVTCKGCQTGYILKQKGSGCVRCPDNSISPGGLATTCVKCADGMLRVDDGSKCGCYGYLRLGYGMQNGVCKQCPPGTYSGYLDEVCKTCKPNEIAKVGECKKCPAFTVPNDDQTACVMCPEGTNPNKRFGAEKCLPK